MMLMEGKLRIVLVATAIVLAAATYILAQPKGHPRALEEETSARYRSLSRKVIDDHASILMKEGRMPTDFAATFTVLGEFGWHKLSDAYSGVYTFHQASFDQAKRSWWIHGTMKAGSDLLVAVNRNSQFECSDWDATSCKMNSPVGFSVGFMYKGPVDAKVLAVVGRSTLRLDKVSPADVLQYDLSILPPDYVDMCQCAVGAAPFPFGGKQ